MTDIAQLIRVTVEAGRDFLTPSREVDQSEPLKAKTDILVPIRSLGENHRERIKAHLLALDERDRYLRFGYAAQDPQIESYVSQLNFERDEIFGVYNRRLKLIAMAHLAMAPAAEHSNCAEFGVSVIASARGRGLGARLFERAALSASNAGIKLMFIHALSENSAMLRIARNAGAVVERDGAESDAYLKLASPTFDTRVEEFVGEQFAQWDYQLKSQAKQFSEFLAELQCLRKSAVDDNHLNGS